MVCAIPAREHEQVAVKKVTLTFNLVRSAAGLSAGFVCSWNPTLFRRRGECVFFFGWGEVWVGGWG